MKMNTKKLLTQALILAINAPTHGQSLRAVELANYYANQLTAKDIQEAKNQAKLLINYL